MGNTCSLIDSNVVGYSIYGLFVRWNCETVSFFLFGGCVVGMRPLFYCAAGRCFCEWRGGGLCRVVYEENRERGGEASLYLAWSKSESKANQKRNKSDIIRF